MAITPYKPGTLQPFTELTVSVASSGITDVSLPKEGKENSLQDKINAVAREMEKRATNLGYGAGIALGRTLGNDVDQIKPKARNSLTFEPKVSEATPFLETYNKLFNSDTLYVLVVEADPGVDDTAAILQLLAATKKEGIKKVEVLGMIPCVGNAVLEQTTKNMLQILELTDNQPIPVFPGAIAPLAIENNATAIEEMAQAINTTHFYGYDGESDVGGWPSVTRSSQKTPGYKAAAFYILGASPETPVTLVSTSSLTELSKTFTELERQEAILKKVPGSFAKNIQAISIMGGCINPAVGCNAPFNVPNNQKNSEANFFFDAPAAKHVFDVCQKYKIPILLAPLDLTQEPGLMWTKQQVEALKRINNKVADQMARVSNVVPYIDALNFPEGSYPMHDLFATANFLFPQYFNVTRISAEIGDVGQVIVKSDVTEEEKNVYVLGMPPEKQRLFYGEALVQYENFGTNDKLSIGKIVAIVTSIVGSVALGVGGFLGWRKCKKIDQTKEQEKLLNADSDV